MDAESSLQGLVEGVDGVLEDIRQSKIEVSRGAHVLHHLVDGGNNSAPEGFMVAGVMEVILQASSLRD